MKTKSDLNALIPTLVNLLSNNNHEIGESYIEQDEDGWSRVTEPISNCLTYEKDGWSIEIFYDCCGDWENERGDYRSPASSEIRKAWGEVTEICATHTDGETGEETEFSDDDDLDELWSALDKVLEKIR